MKLLRILCVIIVVVTVVMKYIVPHLQGDDPGLADIAHDADSESEEPGRGRGESPGRIGTAETTPEALQTRVLVQ